MYVAALKNFGFLGGDEERKFNSFDGGEYGKEKFLQESTGNCPRHRRPCSQPEAAAGSGERPEGADVAQIYQLQAAFHLAKSTQNIDYMMWLWDPNGSLTIHGDPNSPYVGSDKVRAYLLTTGSFTQRRLSLVPSFKIQIDVQGNEAFFYEECHDVGDFDLSTRNIAADSFLAGFLRKIDGKWVFSNKFG